MGHMDDEDQKQTIRIFANDFSQTFHDCTEVETNDQQLVFKDKGGNRHEFYGVSYHIAQE